ncbi:MAG: amino acid adenylation domain-containing protein [bacterium]|nr:amino acid adenylation domain-containing protein [bacterium]
MTDINEYSGMEIAVIGMAGRFPGADNVDDFWENIKNGVESISFFTDEEVLACGIDPQMLKSPNYIKAKGALNDTYGFDAEFFNYTAKEAEIMDPQMRIFHECVWEALENAAYDPRSYDGLIGLYAGAPFNLYWQTLVYFSQQFDNAGLFGASHLFNKDFIPTRVSYNLDLKGPSYSVQTMCSTSLVAIHIACQSLLSGECDIAAAGGVAVFLPEKDGYMYQEGMIFASDGHCRPFDDKADGTLYGSGSGVVVLRRLEDAVEDGDFIHAVILGSATNNDGIRKVGYTATSTKGQAELMSSLHNLIEIDSESISYIETHGTGTMLGDPIEFEALNLAFDSDKKAICGLGTLKANVGHLDAAAGVAGFIKTVMAIKHHQLPPAVNLETPSTKCDFENSPFYISAELCDWESGPHPRRAGVSSFGIGGTNAHVILEEAPARETPAATEGEHILLLSARTETALETMSTRLADHLAQHPQLNPADVAYTLQMGRRPMTCRKMMLFRTLKEVTENFNAAQPKGISTFTARKDRRPVIFLFPGMGSQYANMGAGLYQKEPVFRQEMDRCFQIIKKSGHDLESILYPSAAQGDPASAAGEKALPEDVETAQLVISSFEYSLARLLEHWGMEPHAMIGYSLGEYVAACVAGVFSLEDALTLIARRGKLIRATTPGAMLSIPMSGEKIKAMMGPNLSLAIDNGLSCVVAGAEAAVDSFENLLKEKRMMCMRIRTAYAIHSHVMDPIVGQFREAVAGIRLKEPSKPYISNVTGTWITKKDAVSPDYWTRHLRETVLFQQGIDVLTAEADAVFVEVGPGRDLSTTISRYTAQNPDQDVINMVRNPQKKVDDFSFFLNRIGRLWLFGVSINWSHLYGEQKRYRLPLPTYPFEHKQYRVQGNPFKLRMTDGFDPKTTGKSAMKDWFYRPTWEQAELLQPRQPAAETEVEKGDFLVFSDQTGTGARLTEMLRNNGHQVVTVSTGTFFSGNTDHGFQIHPTDQNDYESLFKELKNAGKLPRHILHMWSVAGGSSINGPDNAEGITEKEGTGNSTPGETREALEKGFYSMLYLVKVFNRQDAFDRLFITVFSDNMQEVDGDESLNPARATLLGPVKVIGQEYPHITCRSIDLPVPTGGKLSEKILRSLLMEITEDSSHQVVAYRGLYRWLEEYRPLVLPDPREDKGPRAEKESDLEKESPVEKKSLQEKESREEIPRVREQGVYLITGGMGGIGFFLALQFARNKSARMVLTGRSPFPPREEWDRWLETHGEDDNTSQKIRGMRECEAAGGRFLILRADVADLPQMQEVVRRTQKTFGPINGVIHSAGIISGHKSIQEIDTAACEVQFQSKVYAMPVLEHLFKDSQVDFCILFSSLGSVLGGLGYFAYAAANAFIDAYVRLYNRSAAINWTAVNWDGWKFTQDDIGIWQELGIEPQEEGLPVFSYILSAAGRGRVVVSTGLLQNRIQQWLQTDTPDESELGGGDSSTRHARPQLANLYIAPTNKRQEKLTEIWQDLLGIEPIGISDDFFELGGHSLNAGTLSSQMHKHFNVSVPIVDIFNNPTIEGLTSCIDTNERSSYFNIEAVEKMDYYPLSSAQKRMFVLNRLEENNTSYNLSDVWEMEGELDMERFQAAFDLLIGHHEALRTVFLDLEGEPKQRVMDTVDYRIPEETAAETDIKTLYGDFLRPFDLAKAPLCRVKVVHLEQEPPTEAVSPTRVMGNRRLIMSDIHHIVSDGASGSLFMMDLFALYKGEEPARQRVRYIDYTVWQNERFASPEMLRQETYWLDRFTGDIPVLQLPLDYPRGLLQSFQGDGYYFSIGKELTARLNQTAATHRATLFMILSAAFSTLLYRYSGQEDIVVGTPVAGRGHPDLEPIIGMFVNTLAMRSFPRGNRSFTDFLTDVREHSLQAIENKDYQFEVLVEKLDVKRDISRNPLFDTMFTLQNVGIETIALEDFDIKQVLFDKTVSKFDLELYAWEKEGGMGFEVEYCSDLFKKETIVGFCEHFCNILERVSESPEVLLKDIQMLSETEKDRLLHKFNDTAVPYPGDKTITQLFSEKAAAHPDLIAISSLQQDGKPATRGGKNLPLALPAEGSSEASTISTYATLYNESGRLASVLKARGVGAGSIVALLLERSKEMMVGLFGILRAGAAYLPIDPACPGERLQYMLADSNAALLLSTRATAGTMSADTEILYLDQLDGLMEEEPAAAPLFPSDSLAYIIYTSGSTGKPKGVMVEHRSLVNRLHWMQRFYPIGEEDVILQKTTYTFDVSVWELFWWSLEGASVALLGPGEEKSPEAIVEAIENFKITTMHFVPSMLTAFLQYLEGSGDSPASLASLRRVFASGEALTVNQVVKFNQLLNEPNKTRLINLYGPTEATIDVSYFNCSEGRAFDTIPIGKPIDNTTLLILGKGNILQPVEVAGQLCIGGHGLARGYLNRPLLTAEKFIANPFQAGAASVNPADVGKASGTDSLYLTGDLARLLPDGNIEFLGRIDHQVKIRGFRIELGEIENRLLEHDSVTETVVIDREDSAGNKYLCGYIVPAPGSDHPFEPALLKEFLTKHLPAYMVPTYLVPMDSLPLGTSGKINRKALPEPKLQVDASLYEAPANTIEETLVRVWQEVLGLEKVGVKDNFFEIGGDSIKAIQITSRLQKYKLKLKTRDLFLHLDIRSLARHVGVADRVREQVTVTGDVPLTPIQNRFFETACHGFHHYNQSVILFRKEGFSPETLSTVFAGLTGHHDALRMVFAQNEERVGQENRGLEGNFFRLETIDLTTAQHSVKETSEAIKKEADRIQGGIDLAAGPLLHAALFNTNAGDYLLIVVHHLVIDGVSWRILLEDLAAGYNQTEKGESLSFPPKTDSFKYWAEQSIDFAAGHSATREIPYWKALEETDVEPLPADHPLTAGERKYCDLHSLSVTLDEKETQSLLTETNRAFNTRIDDLLLTALGLAYQRWCGRDRLLINLEGHGREDIGGDMDVSRSIGWFTSLYPVLLAPWDGTPFTRGGSPVREDVSYALRNVKESLRRIPANGIGYGLLKYLAPANLAEEIHFSLQPGILFNYLGSFDAGAGEADGLFTLTDMPTGANSHPDMINPHALEIDAVILDGKMTLTFGYNKKEFETDTIKRLADFYLENLSELITLCLNREAQTPTPSDYGCPSISLETLDLIGTEIKTAAGDTGIKMIYPLSPMQGGLLFHSLVDGGSSAYFQQGLISLEGDIRPPAMEKSMATIIDRYDVLRTLFLHRELDTPLQVVLENPQPHVTGKAPHNVGKEKAGKEDAGKEDVGWQPRFLYRDISGMDESKRDDYLENYYLEDRREGFRLTRDILLRMALFKTGEKSYRLLWSWHHIIMDGWCLGILFKDFLQVYLSIVNDKPLALEPAVPYRNYIDWLDKQDKDQHMSYWTEYLEGYIQAVGLPPRTTAAAETEYHLEEETYTLQAGLSTTITDLTRSSRVTVNSFFQALWGMLLCRCNGTNDVVYGSVVSGRGADVKGIESMVGLFINTVPVRVNTKGFDNFHQLLLAVQHDSTEAKPYEYLPLAEIQAHSSLKNNLLDHLLVFENYPFDEMVDADHDTETGFQVKGIEMFEQTNYDFYLTVEPLGQMVVKFSYNSEVYDGDMMKRSVGHLLHLLHLVTEEPQIQLDHIEIITPAEKREIMEEFNDTAAPFSGDRSVHHLISDYAEKHPHRVALVNGDFLVTYGELDRRANLLAQMLDEKGIGTDCLAGILQDRSHMMVEGILAVWKAGGAYIPMDTANPVQRTGEILADSGAPVLLTHSRFVDNQLREYCTADIIDIDDFFTLQKDTAPQPLVKDTVMNALAYVIYTSGSTGRPKGVMVEHIGMMNHLQAKVVDLELDEESIVVQNASHTFDISIWQFFSALITGGRTVIYSNTMVLDVRTLVNRVKADNVTILEVVPSYLSVILNEVEGDTSPLAELAFLLVTGETVKPDLTKRWFQLYPSIKVVNAYGPTEASDDITHYIMDRHPGTERISIGSPVQNFNIYILDPHMHLCPLGIKGEICVSGVGVGRGYLNDHIKTGLAFMEDPLVKGRRLYKTGDLGCWLPDGSIDFFGRKDYQVKIRGYRIEMGEIENRLVELEQVNEAVVVDGEDETGGKYLCAYIVTLGKEADIPQLKALLAGTLPEYMVPAYFVPMAALPLTPNGKIDRKALPLPGIEADEEYLPPTNEVEEILVQVWQEVLGLTKVGINQNLFEIGGDSIKAIQITSRMQRHKLKIKINDLFMHPVIKDLAPLVELSRREIPQGPVEGEVPPTPIQEWFLQAGFSQPHHYNQSVMIHREQGFDAQLLQRVLTAVVSHHDALRMVFVREGDRMVQRNRTIDEGTLFDFETITCTHPPVKRLAEEIRGHADRLQAAVKLDDGPLVKTALFKTSDGDHLLIIVHHLVIDGISWRILLEDFAEAYQQAAENRDITLQGKTDSFKYWAENIRQYAKSKNLLKEIAYWKNIENQTFEPPEPDYQPTKDKLPEKYSAEVSVTLSEEETGLLLKEVNWAYSTKINDVLLTALGLSLERWCGTCKLRVNLEGHGREEIMDNIDTGRSIGWFTSEYPVVLKMERPDDIAFSLKAVKEGLRLIPNKGIGYGILRYLTPPQMKEELVFRERPRVAFNYMGQFEEGSTGRQFSMSDMPLGDNASLLMESLYLLEINSMIADGKLEVRVAYNTFQLKSERARALADTYKDFLLAIIQHCTGRKQQQLTPSDVGDTDLSIEELEDIEGMFD